MHDAEQVVARVLETRPLFLSNSTEIVVGIVAYILPDDSDVVISVPPRVLVPETYGMAELVHGVPLALGSFAHAAGIDRNFLRSSYHPDVRRTTEKMNRGSDSSYQNTTLQRNLKPFGRHGYLLT